MTKEQTKPVVRPGEEWHEEIGQALWWVFPVQEPPYVGTPLDDDWPGYHTHWTPIEVPEGPQQAVWIVAYSQRDADIYFNTFRGNGVYLRLQYVDSRVKILQKKGNGRTLYFAPSARQMAECAAIINTAFENGWILERLP